MLLKNQSESKKIRLFFFLAFLFVLVFNIITPLAYDDFSYRNVWGENREVKSLTDVITSQYNHWKTWGGRSVAHFIAQIFLALPSKMYFNICNSLMYMLLIYLIGKLSFRKHLPRAIDYVFIFFLSWIAFAEWGSVFLWLIGSCNYLWTTVFAISYVYFFLYMSKTEVRWIKSFRCLGFFILGILAGWSNENTGASLVFFSICAILWCHFVKKEIISIESYFGTIGTLTGFLLMILAPGNYVRLDGVSLHGYEQINFFVTVFCRFFIYLAVFLYTNIPLIIITIIMFIKKRPTKSFFKESNAVLLLAAFFVGQNSMVLSPEYPPRAVTIVTLYFMCFVMSYFDFYQEDLENLSKSIFNVLLILFILFSGISLYGDIRIKKGIKEMENAIVMQKENGEMDIVVESPKASFFNSHSVVAASSQYLSDNPYHWFNRQQASIYGVNSIKGIH